MQWGVLVALLLIWAVGVGQAATLQVGPTRPYATPQAAMAAAQPEDIIEIDPVLYKGQAATNLLIDKNVTIRGVNGRPQFDCDDTGVFSIGCWVVHTTTTDVTIENVELYDFRTPASASCIRVNTPGRFSLRHSYLHDCQQLLLTSNQGTQQFWLENNLFTNGGRPGAQEHNVYIGTSAELVFLRNRSWNSNGGQDVKTRSARTVIAHNVIGDLEARTPASNLELDISCGGDAYLAMNQFHQARYSPNQAVVTFGPEGCQSGPQKLVVVGNTFHNEASGSQPTMLRVRKQAAVTTFDLLIEHNLQIGPGTLFEAYDRNLAPDLTTNTTRALPPPPIAYVGPPEQVQHSLTSAGIVLSWVPAPGATGTVVRRNGITLPVSGASATDAGPHAPGAILTYELHSLQGTAESRPTMFTVVTPRPLPLNPTSESFTIGWYEVPNSRYQQVYPQPPAHATRYLVEAWSGAGYDPMANRFLLFGGGHPDYTGNELVSVPFQGAPSLIVPASTNLDIAALPNPVEALLDGKPSGRHSYGGLAYAPELQTLFVFGGSLPRAVAGRDLWSLNLTPGCACATWQKRAYTGDVPEATFGTVAAWNPTDGQLWIKTTSHLYSYNPATNVMTKRNTASMVTGIYHSGVIDVARQLFVLANDKHLYTIALTGTPALHIAKVFLQEETLNGWPGMAYDSDLQRVVIWNGGTRFGILTATGYTEIQVPGGPGAAVPTRTHDRFVYIPQWRVFGLQNYASQNLFVVRID